MPAWLADNSFSWSKLKKSITAVWKCNASTLEPHSATMRHQARGKGERRRVPSMCHIWLAQLQSLSRQPVTGNRAWKGPRAGMKLQISLAASTSLSLLHSAPSSYSFSHLHSPSLCVTHMLHMESETYFSVIMAIYNLLHTVKFAHRCWPLWIWEACVLWIRKVCYIHIGSQATLVLTPV